MQAQEPLSRDDVRRHTPRFSTPRATLSTIPGIELVQVLTRSELIAALGIDKSTLDRMEARGEGPTKTQLSANRVGYRTCHVNEWLDQRRIGQAVAA